MRGEPDPGPEKRDVVDEPPPFLGTWGRVYTAVVIYLALLILVFYWFARVFAA